MGSIRTQLAVRWIYLEIVMSKLSYAGGQAHLEIARLVPYGIARLLFSVCFFIKFERLEKDYTTAAVKLGRENLRMYAVHLSNDIILG